MKMDKIRLIVLKVIIILVNLVIRFVGSNDLFIRVNKLICGFYPTIILNNVINNERK